VAFQLLRPGSDFSLVNTKGDTMSSKLIPSNPADVMVIREVTPRVVTFSVPFLRFGMIPIGGRGTVVKLTSGALAVFSPVALTPETKAKVAALGGRVQYIVALDYEHHIFVSDWAKEYPSAKLIGPEGLPEKRQKMAASSSDPKVTGPETFSTVFTKADKLTTRIDPDFDRDFEYEYVDAHPNKEIVFFYKPDRVLIEADLMFNLPAIEQYSRVPEADKPKPGVLARVFSGLQTTEGEAKGMKRLMWYAFSRPDREGFNASMQRIARWDFDTVVPCHGETIVGNGKEVFDKIFEWHLQGHK